MVYCEDENGIADLGGQTLKTVIHEVELFLKHVAEEESSGLIF